MRFWFRPMVMPLAATVLLAALLTGAAGCGGSRRASRPEPADRAYAQTSQAARLAFQKGDYQTADDLFRKALQRAFARNELEAIVDTRYNLALCLLKLGRYDEALLLTDLATSELTRAGREIPPELDLLKATVLYQQGRATEAWSLTEALVSTMAGLPTLVYSRTHYIRGRLAADQNDADRLRAAITALGAPSLDPLQADLQDLRGRLAMLEERWDAAAAAFDDTARLRRRASDYPEMSAALALAARACAKAGRRDAAAERYLQAGRSAVARGAEAQGRAWLEQVLQLSDPSQAADPAAEARSLLDQADRQADGMGPEALSSDRNAPAASPE